MGVKPYGPAVVVGGGGWAAAAAAARLVVVVVVVVLLGDDSVALAGGEGERVGEPHLVGKGGGGVNWW